MRQEARVLTGRGDPVRLGVAGVTPDFLDVWGVEMARGRHFTREDAAPGAAPAVLLSHGFWSRSMGRDEGVLGETLMLDGTAHTVVGIVSEEMEFAGMSGIEVWLPLRLEAAGASRLDHDLLVVGRLAPGTSLEQFRSEVASRWEAVAEAYPVETRDWGLEGRSTEASLVNENARLDWARESRSRLSSEQVTCRWR